MNSDALVLKLIILWILKLIILWIVKLIILSIFKLIILWINNTLDIKINNTLDSKINMDIHVILLPQSCKYTWNHLTVSPSIIVSLLWTGIDSAVLSLRLCYGRMELTSHTSFVGCHGCTIEEVHSYFTTSTLCHTLRGMCIVRPTWATCSENWYMKFKPALMCYDNLK